MASSINASTSGAGGVITTADNSGILNLQSGGVTVATISPTGIAVSSAAAPAFSAYVNPYISTTNGAFTILACNIKEFDTAGCYNNTGSTVTLNGLSVPAWSFCPNVAGYYQINSEVEFANTVTSPLVSIYKNNVEAKRGVFMSSLSGFAVTVGTIIYLNGTGDYITSKVYQSSGSSQNTQTGDYGTTNYFQAFLARSA